MPVLFASSLQISQNVRYQQDTHYQKASRYHFCHFRNTFLPTAMKKNTSRKLGSIHSVSQVLSVVLCFLSSLQHLKDLCRKLFLGHPSYSTTAAQVVFGLDSTEGLGDSGPHHSSYLTHGNKSSFKVHPWFQQIYLFRM